jgi:hypothetical protein
VPKSIWQNDGEPTNDAADVRRFEGSYLAPITRVAVSPDGGDLAIRGGAGDGKPDLRIWRLPENVGSPRK